MWKYEIKGKQSQSYNTKEEALFYAATIIRFYLVRFSDEEDWNEDKFINSIPNIYIYKDDELEEIIEGRTLI